MTILKRRVPEQLRHHAQIHLGHNKSTGKGMAVAMPVAAGDAGLFESDRKC
jgi:hypothetical protein